MKKRIKTVTHGVGTTAVAVENAVEPVDIDELLPCVRPVLASITWLAAPFDMMCTM